MNMSGDTMKLVATSDQRKSRPGAGEFIAENYEFSYRGLNQATASRLIGYLQKTDRIVDNWRSNGIISEYVVAPVDPEPIELFRVLGCPTNKEFMLAISDIIMFDEYVNAPPESGENEDGG